jgi:hypothetical protein
MSVAAWRLPSGRSCHQAALSSLLVVALWPVPPSHAQAFRTQAGSSTLNAATGGSLEVRGRAYDASVGAGEIFGHFRFGMLVRKRSRGYTLGVGDDAVDFPLSTDASGGRYYFLARGASLAVKRTGLSLFGLAGTTANGIGAPFFRAADSDAPVGLLFLDKQISPQWRVLSRNVVSERQTSLHGVEWRARQPLRLNAVGGIGANEGYAAASATYDGTAVVAHASYVTAGREFRRIQVASTSSEVDRENLSIAIRPSPLWSLAVSHQNLLQPDPRERAPRVVVNHVGGNLNAAGFRLTAGVFDAHGQRADSLGASFGLARALTDTADASLTYFTSRSGRGPASTSVVTTFREAIGPRLTLVQVATQAARQTSVKIGGSFLSNPIAVGVDYQTLYAPFRTGDPFVQALSLSVRVLVQSLQIQVASYMTPTGRIRYTVSGSHSLSRSTGGGTTTDNVRLAKYVIRGQVIEENDRPVPGAVVRINDEFVMTDSQGQFSLRTKKAAPCRLRIATDEFLGPGYFEVSSAPGSVLPTTDDMAATITIRVRRSNPPSGSQAR